MAGRGSCRDSQPRAPEVPEEGLLGYSPAPVWGRQGHCPLTGSQKQASASGGHLTGLVPGDHSCNLGTGRGLTGAEGRRSTSTLGRPHPPTHTLTGSLGWGTAMEARPAVGTANTVAVCRSALLAMSTVGYRRQLGHGDQYCCCTGRAAGTPSGVISRPGVPKVAGSSGLAGATGGSK